MRVYPLPDSRELRLTRMNGLVVVATGTAGSCISGPIALHESDLPTLRAALAEVAAEIADAGKEPRP